MQPNQFDLKAIVFTTAQKVTKHLSKFYNKIYCQEIPKIAQSSHTGQNPLSENMDEMKDFLAAQDF